MEHPNSKLAKAALTFVEPALSPIYFRHTLRSYACAKAYAAKHRLEYDDEGLWVAMMFHDLGLFPPYRDRKRPFQVVGGEHLSTFLEKHKVDPDRRANLVRAVDYHMQPLPRWSLSNEVGLLHVGAWMDALCVRRWSVWRETAELERENPRGLFLWEATTLVMGTVGSVASVLGMWLPDRYR